MKLNMQAQFPNLPHANFPGEGRMRDLLPGETGVAEQRGSKYRSPKKTDPHFWGHH